MKLYTGQNFPDERDLYGADGVKLIGCTFDGAADGESALKEARNVILENCYMNLRYPLWHNNAVEIKGVEMTENCRAALWYSSEVKISESKLNGIKALRECEDVTIDKSRICSPEFGWKSSVIRITDTEILSQYAFLLARDIKLDKVKFTGKYAFQYVRSAVIENSVLDTKDAFWHAQNVTVKNCTVKGEYLGWYSENMTFINCEIIGTQPLCYCKNLKLGNCTMRDTDLSFEYSDVDAHIYGSILSVKNPRSGKINADGIGEVILTEDSKYPCNCKITIGAQHSKGA